MKKIISLFLNTAFIAIVVGCGPKYENRFLEDQTAIDNYLISKGLVARVDASGVRFIIQNLGKGLPARQDQRVKVAYEGRTLGGPVFETGTAEGLLNTFIPGWQIGIPLILEGGKAALYIPSDLAYGPKVVGNIPANSILVFQVEVLDVVVTDSEKNQLAVDVAKIDEYLAANSITAVQDTTGIRYVIHETGTGLTTSWYDLVSFNYTEKIMATGSEVATGSAGPTDNFSSRIINYFPAFQIGLQKIQDGGKITLYVPSGLAYGSTSSQAVPANTNMIYELQLTGVAR